ncbi:hypothetical protein QBC38DRAFT_230369 [Podospora fimiseda]|uniref:Uncharacterized protein n=1 Tax=Podospora fimiseda TaxID=252190 RepID=A0AAN7H149_9PEZI|nr:hypothetical protein QBC38DRAFT_230369 [Podospora fimiseda]
MKPSQTSPPSSSRLSSLLSFASQQFNRIAPPETRSKLYSQTSQFASARPLVFSFLATQLLLSFIPLLLFISFSISTILFSLAAALFFSLFWLGVAALFLIPTLCVIGGIGVLFWVWGVGSYVAGKWALGVLNTYLSSTSPNSSAVAPPKYEAGPSKKVKDVKWAEEFSGIKNESAAAAPPYVNGNGKEKGDYVKVENKFEVLGTD